MRRDNASVDSDGRRASFESGGEREQGTKGVFDARVAVGSRNDVMAEETDLVR